MSEPQNPLPAHTGIPQPAQAPAAGSTSSFSGAPAMPAPTTLGYAPSPVSAAAPGSTRPAWSAYLRIAAWVVIVVKVIFALERFVPYDFTYLKYFIAQFTDPFFWFLLSLDAAVVVALGLAMMKRLSVLRYVVAATILVNYFVFIPVLIASTGGDWVRAFAPPQ